MKKPLTTKEIDRIMLDAITLIERESGGELKLGEYTLWTQYGIFIWKFKTKTGLKGLRAFHKWHKELRESKKESA